MKKLAAVLIAGFLSGCVAYPVERGHGYGGYRDRDGVTNRADRDGDGVRNRDDRRPNDPRRY